MMKKKMKKMGLGVRMRFWFGGGGWGDELVRDGREDLWFLTWMTAWHALLLLNWNDSAGLMNG